MTTFFKSIFLSIFVCTLLVPLKSNCGLFDKLAKRLLPKSPTDKAMLDYINKNKGTTEKSDFHPPKIPKCKCLTCKNEYQKELNLFLSQVDLFVTNFYKERISFHKEAYYKEHYPKSGEVKIDTISVDKNGSVVVHYSTLDKKFFALIIFHTAATLHADTEAFHYVTPWQREQWGEWLCN